MKFRWVWIGYSYLIPTGFKPLKSALGRIIFYTKNFREEHTCALKQERKYFTP
jgi:hypothetical protein